MLRDNESLSIEFLLNELDCCLLFSVFSGLHIPILAVSSSMFLMILKSIELRYCLNAFPVVTYSAYLAS